MKLVILLIVLVVLFLIISIVCITYYSLKMAFVVPDNRRQYIPINNGTDEISLRLAHMREEGLEKILQANKKDIYCMSEDGIQLHATFFPTLNEDTEHSNITILFMHGYCSNGLNDISVMFSFLLSLGYNLLVPDQRGHGKSEGRYVTFGAMESRDVISWINYLGDRQQILLYGLSMGAASVCSASGDVNLPSSVKCVIADSPFTSAFDVVALSLRRNYKVGLLPLYLVDAYYSLFKHYSMRDRTPIDMISNTKIPILIIQGEDDVRVPAYMSKAIFDKAKCKKDYLLIEGAGHCRSYLVDESEYVHTVTRFIREALDEEVLI